MGAYTGRDVLIEMAIALPDATYGSLSFLELGMCRGKGINVNWDTADATADKSAEYTRENLVTFKQVEVNIDGVARTESVHNQATFKGHCYNPGAGTNNQPMVWIRQTAPDGVTYGPFILSSWESTAPYDDVVTWSFSALSNGAVTFEPT